MEQQNSNPSTEILSKVEELTTYAKAKGEYLLAIEQVG